MVLALDRQVVADDPGSVHGERGAGGGGIIGTPADDPSGLAVGASVPWQVWQAADGSVLTDDFHRSRGRATGTTRHNYSYNYQLLFSSLTL